MNFLEIIEKKSSISSVLLTIPWRYIAFKVLSRFWILCSDFVTKWMLISKAYLAVKCGR